MAELIERQPLFSIYNPEIEFTHYKPGTLIDLIPIKLKESDEYKVVFHPQRIYGIISTYHLCVLIKRDDKIYSMGFFGHPETRTFTLSSPDRIIEYNTNLMHAVFLNGFKPLEDKTDKMNKLISNYTTGEYLGENIKIGINKQHNYNLTTNNCISGFIDIVHEDIPFELFGGLERLCINYARRNKSVDHGGKKYKNKRIKTRKQKNNYML